MKQIDIQTNDKDYTVYIGNCLSLIKEGLSKKEEILVITDDVVQSLHLNTLLNFLPTQKVHVFSIGRFSEDGKTLSVYQACIEFALSHYLTRNLTVIAFGGGAVGDFAGFFASTYKRGVSFIQIPTTLLAHDSAIGGKNGLNVEDKKNMIGTFYQPEVVFYHLEFLKTLNKTEILSGFGEIIKHDYLSVGDIKNYLIKNDTLDSILFKEDLLEAIIYKAILIKLDYIKNDFYDQLGLRHYLNLGHTLAHGIERLHDMPHGQAVALGLCFDLFLSGNDDSLTLYNWFLKQGYFQKQIHYDEEQLSEQIKNDKKNSTDKIRFIGLKEIGKPYIIDLTPDEFKKAFKEFKRQVIQ